MFVSYNITHISFLAMQENCFQPTLIIMEWEGWLIHEWKLFWNSVLKWVIECFFNESGLKFLACFQHTSLSLKVLWRSLSIDICCFSRLYLSGENVLHHVVKDSLQWNRYCFSVGPQKSVCHPGSFPNGDLGTGILCIFDA